MHAAVGDQLVRLGRFRDLGEIVGSVIEVPNGDGSPPFLVKYYRDGREDLVVPDGHRFRIIEHRVPSADHPAWG
jgi:hypothetical protein